MDKWDLHWLRAARLTALDLSKDPRTKVGAVAVYDRRVLSSGYNGFPKGFADTEERLNDRPTKNKYVVHAELNCLLNAGRTGVALAGATMYVYGLPVCRECAKSVAQAGISKVIMCHEIPMREDWRESCSEAAALLEECGVDCESYDLKDL